MITFDILSYLVIFVDVAVATFLIWRATAKKATLWGSARFIYIWVTALTFFHLIVYVVSLFSPNPDELISSTLHPVVLFYMLNPLLIAIIHWRGGHLWKD